MFIFNDPYRRMCFDGEGGGGGGQGGSGSGQGAGGDGGQGSGSGSGDGQGQGGSGSGQGSGSGHEERVPYDRFAEVNERAQAAERERDQLRQQITELERQGLPELDRARAEAQDAAARAEAAERERDQLRADTERRSRADWVRAAAREFELDVDGQTQRVRFHDVEDAVARINIDELRSEQSAQRDVAALAGNARHLVTPVQQQQTQQQSGGDLLQQVLERGEPVGDNGNGNGNGDGQRQQQVLPADTFNAMTADQLVALQETDPDLYARSLRAAAQS